MIEEIGIWIAAFLTLCIFSFLFKDNHFYRLAEHLLVGVSAGYWVARYTWATLWPKLFKPLFAGENFWLIFLFILGIMMFGKLTPNFKWTSRWSIAFVVGCTVGLAINAKLQANVVEQCRATIRPFAGNPAIVFEAMSATVGKKVEQGISLPEMENFYKLCIAQPLPKNRDGKAGISIEEWGKFSGIPTILFSRIDKDRDDFITPKEFQRFQNHYPNQYTDELKNLKDWDNDGRISRVECEQFPGLPKNLFLFLDKDKNHNLSSDELALLRKKIRSHFPANFHRFFQEADQNKDQLLSSQEWHSPPFLCTYDQTKPAAQITVWNFWNTTFVKGILVFIGTLCGLIYFFFSTEHKMGLGVASKVGIYFLMLCFGASFGYTVMARISLLIGRMIFLMKDWLGIMS